MRLLLLNVVDLKIRVFLYFAHVKVFSNFSFLCTYRSSCVQTSAFDVGHLSDSEISLEKLYVYSARFTFLV